MKLQRRWICHVCHRESIAPNGELSVGLPKWDGETCLAPGCGSRDIEEVWFTPPFPGGDWHPIAEPPPMFEPPDLTPPDRLNIHENRTLALVQAQADAFDYGTS